MDEDPVDTTTNNDGPKRKWRKKRKNFLSNAKKYAKKGQLGRGTQMPEELFQYFVGILETMKKGVETDEERRSLVDNVLERTKDVELIIIGNQLGCRVIELLLPHSSDEDFERFIDILSPELRRLCSDNFCSHVVETVLRVASTRATESLNNEELDTNDSDTEETPKKKPKLEGKIKLKHSKKHINICNEFTLKLCKYAVNNLEDFVWDSYANHILRSALKCLSGITLLPGEKPKVNMFLDAAKDNKGIPPHQTKLDYRNTPQDYKDIVVDFANRIYSWPQLKDMPYQNITSGLLQVLLFAIKNIDESLTKKFIKKLLNESFAPDDWVGPDSGPYTGPDTSEDKKENKQRTEDDNPDEDDTKQTLKAEVSTKQNKLPPVFESEPAVRLLEACLFVAKKKMYTQIYAKCFINRLAQLALMPMLNFTVQRLFDNCLIKEEFEPMFEELTDKYDAVLVSGNTGVLVALAKACLRIKAKQTQFVNNLESALKCGEPEQQKYFPVCCLRLLPADRLQPASLDKEYFINVHGSVILQTMLHFQRPAKAVAGLLELPSEQLARVLCDAKGSHVADALFTAQFVGVKARDKLLWKLQGHYQQLALSQHGSHALTRALEACTPEQRARAERELAHHAGLLRGTRWGRRVAEQMGLQA